MSTFTSSETTESVRVISVRTVHLADKSGYYFNPVSSISHSVTLGVQRVTGDVYMYVQPCIIDECEWLWKKPVMCLDHSRCSKWRPFAFTHARCRVCHWSMDTGFVDYGSGPRLMGRTGLAVQLVPVFNKFSLGCVLRLQKGRGVRT